MKKNDVVKLAVVSLAAGFCLSGQVARETNQEGAMTKSSKATAGVDTDTDGSNSGLAQQQSEDQASQNMMDKRKGAAKRVVRGEEKSNTSANTETRKSAAQIAIDRETERVDN